MKQKSKMNEALYVSTVCFDKNRHGLTETTIDIIKIVQPIDIRTP